jgi:transcriptional repressor NrdR
MKITRRNGRREDFVREKVIVSIVKSGGNIRRARSIAREVERAVARNRPVTTRDIRSEVLSRLEERDPRAYRSWLAYDRQKKR